MAPSDVKQCFLTPSLKLMVYLMIVENFTWTKCGRFWLPFHSNALSHPHLTLVNSRLLTLTLASDLLGTVLKRMHLLRGLAGSLLSRQSTRHSRRFYKYLR